MGDRLKCEVEGREGLAHKLVAEGRVECTSMRGGCVKGPECVVGHGQCHMAVAYVNRKGGGKRSSTLLQLRLDMSEWLEQQQCTVRARHSPGSLNVIADRRFPKEHRGLPAEWSLLREVLDLGWEQWDSP